MEPKPVAPESGTRTVPLAEEIIRHGKLAFNPDLSMESRAIEISRFNNLLASTKTKALMPVLTSLVQLGRVEPWLRPHLTHTLALLPLRPGGVRHTIEFILSVHPSTAQKAGSAPSQTPEPRGPSISLEALNAVSRLISSPPSGLSAEEWFLAISPQLLSLLDGEGGLEMIKSASYVIGYGILGRKTLGAPGASGWKNFAEPILSRIDPTAGGNNSTETHSTETPDEKVTHLRPKDIIVPAADVAVALRRLASLLSSHPNPGLSKRLLEKLLLPLWSLASWSDIDDVETEEQWCVPARFLLQILLQLSTNGSHIKIIASNILYQGNETHDKIQWAYGRAPAGGIQIVKVSTTKSVLPSFNTLDLEILDKRIESFIDLVKPLKENDDVPTLFLSLCRRWLLKKEESSPQNILTTIQSAKIYEPDLNNQITDARLMQKLMDCLPDRLVDNSKQIVELAGEVLKKVISSGDELDEDDTVNVALSLLNMVFTSTSFGRTSEDLTMQKSITSSLEVIARSTESETSSTARNLLLLLDFKATEPNSGDNKPTALDKNLDDRRSYSLAMSYLTAADSPPPVRAQGLDLISTLIGTSSAVLDVPATQVLLSSLLHDEEEYIYLRVIKAYILLSVKHPKVVMLGLLERYIDASEESSLDFRLRLGEALLQVVQKSGQIFTGELALQVSEGLLGIAGRRIYRPKQEAAQRNKARLTKSKNQEAEKAWGGPVPQLEDVPDTEVNDQTLNKIMEGWEGKRGEEDVRARASALSIFGSAIETNIAGLRSSTISSAVDLCINILALESEHEKAILRRAALLLVMSLVRALDTAEEEGRKLAFGFAGQSLDDVLRILRYVSETDNDGLVRQHAKDVIEGLETWQIKGLLAPRTESGIQLGELAGLSIGSNPSITSNQRPRIEEIE